MKGFQGPALAFYNDAEFRPDDFDNLATIGQGNKLGQVGKTGRFGLGFNSVYHFTDVPSFVSGDHIVFLDPHAKHIPYATPSQPGVRINFDGDFQGSIASQFADQFEPYKHLFEDFNIDSKRDYVDLDDSKGARTSSRTIEAVGGAGGGSGNGSTGGATAGTSDNQQRAFRGTLFRFPLRQSPSDISKRVSSIEAAMDLLVRFEQGVQDSLLFLKNVRSIEVCYIGDNVPAEEALEVGDSEQTSTDDNTKRPVWLSRKCSVFVSTLLCFCFALTAVLTVVDVCGL